AQLEGGRRLAPGLKGVGVMPGAPNIACSWCMALGYWDATTRHDAMAEKIRAIPDWQDSEVFTELERLVMLYAEAMTMTPPLVTDDLVARLRQHLGVVTALSRAVCAPDAEAGRKTDGDHQADAGGRKSVV